MKKLIKVVALLLSFFFLFILNSCKRDASTKPAKSCDEQMAELDPVKVYLILNDLYELEQEISNPERNSVGINEKRVEEEYKLLNVIKYLNSPQSDSIFNILHAVHADYQYLQYISITLPDSSFLNTDAELKSIIRKYKLTVEDISFGSSVAWITLKSCTIINTYALKRELEKNVKSVMHVNLHAIPHKISLKYPHGKNIEIKDDPSDNSKFVKIYIGWGDCPAGCIYNYTWEFKVYNDFSVKHIRSYGRL